MSEDFDVVVERTMSARVQRVWDAWRHPADLRQWWGPTGFTCPRADVDFREGGRIFVTMRAPDAWGGFEQHSTWSLTQVRPLESLTYVFQFADGGGAPITPGEAGIPFPGVPERGEHEVHLSALSEGTTLLRMVEHGYTTSEARDMSAVGLEQCLDKMAALVENGTAAASWD